MLLSTSLDGINQHREALQDPSSVSNPTYISEHAHRLTQYTAAAEDHLSDLMAELEKKESVAFNKHIADGMSANASKEMLRREFPEDRANIVKISKLVSSSWRLVNESQSRVKHLIAEANNQI